MTLTDKYHGFLEALATGQIERLPDYVDPDAYTENCVGLTGWTTGLDVALTNFQYGILQALTDFNQETREIIEAGDTLIVRARIMATHSGPFLGILPTHRPIVWDAVDMFRAGADGRIVWRYLISDWEAARKQMRGGTADSETPVHYAIHAPSGHPNAKPPA